MINEDQFYEIYRLYEEVITGMNIKLMNFKKKNPELDITESLDTINTLRALQNYWHQLYHHNISLKSTHGRWYNERSELSSAWAQKELSLEARIKFLEAENKMLKQDISINPSV